MSQHVSGLGLGKVYMSNYRVYSHMERLCISHIVVETHSLPAKQNRGVPCLKTMSGAQVRAYKYCLISLAYLLSPI